MIRFLLVFVALLAPSASRAQTAFDPATVAYVLCVTNETKKFALETPPLARNDVIDRAFRVCNDLEAETRKSLAAQGMSAAVIDERFVQIKKFIAQTAQDDIDRLRANSTPR